MKKIYSDNGYDVYSVNICGYNCELHDSTQSGYVVSVPIGDTKQDKTMFDSLVYHNKGVYWDKDRDTVLKKVEQWIQNYKSLEI